MGESEDAGVVHPIETRNSTAERLAQPKEASGSVASKIGRKVKPVMGPLAGLSLLAFFAGSGVAAFLWLTSLPPLPNCKHPQTLGLDSEKLFCVEQAARSGSTDSLLAGLEFAKGLSADHPLHSRVQELMDGWSSSVLELARVKAIELDLKGAIALAQKIPVTSPVHKEAKAAITNWQKDLTQGQAIINSVQAAMKARNWGLAVQQLRKLSKLESEYWVQHVDRLRQKISSEQIAADQLQQARRLVKSSPKDIQVLGRAIALAEQISPDTHAHTQAKADVEGWIQSLFTLVAGKLSPHTDLKGATAALQGLPRGIPAPDARDVLWFSRAQPLVNNQITRGPLYEQLWQLWLVLSQIRQIKPNSPLYAQTKGLFPKLERQIQDVTQLQAATMVASWWQIPTFQLAIQMAQGIAPDRPRRVYAQTLVSMWKADIQRVEDRPLLTQAQQYAATGKPETLRIAIAYAQQIAPKRPLRVEAQTAIAQWTQQIQLIEDGPLLEQAQTFAKQQRLGDAIRVAAKIRPGRSLYKEAQTAIQDWTYQLQVAQDRPLLDQATALAGQGQLTSAINTAAQIAPWSGIVWGSAVCDRQLDGATVCPTASSPEST
ncbi:hypothetical protein K9N68_31940 [Kovacikia minuta CCNUW1]|uniref:hypothetical protein n=1 Tax=Kovacikia minuta TaxID=2931930 RepID=UPI001CCB0762|nr:hypothetical protein [Kovacikia minuta]UBF26092.1 hypothetical protein K9N68_31940 [Kovacikia minuta CCNUW1]